MLQCGKPIQATIRTRGNAKKASSKRKLLLERLKENTVRDGIGVVCSVRIVNTLVLLCNNTKAYFLADKEGFYDKRKTRTQTV